MDQALFRTSDALPGLIERLRHFVDDHCIPAERSEQAHDVAALDTAITRLRPLAREFGIYAPQLPRALGGQDLSWCDRAVLLEEAGRSPLAPAAMNCAPPDQPNMINLLRHGTPAQQQRYLQPLAAGELRSCFAMTEPAPGAGSDPSMLRTTAQRRNGRWVIDGHKWFISGAVSAAFAIVLARTDKGPTLFLVDTNQPGYRLVRNVPAIGAFAIGGHAELRFEGCEVGDDAVLGEVGKGFTYVQERLEPARLSHCLRYIGRARRALDTAQAYVLQRESFGSRLADLQQIQAMVADSSIDLHASRLMSRDCAARLDAGLPVKDESAMAKVFVSEAVNRVADRAAQMMGALGMSEDTIVAHIVAELRPFRIYDGASELHRATLGRRLLRASDKASAEASELA